MPSAIVRPLCYGTLLAAWVVDLLTPELFVAAIFMNVPIALSSIVLDERLTRVLIGLALAANISAGYANGLATGAHWDAIAIGDRTVTGLSFFLVGVLTIASQRSARRSGELAERNDRANRERHVSTAIDRIRSSMSVELVQRAIVREAQEALGADVAWYLEHPLSLVYPGAAGDVEIARGSVDPAIASLNRRILDDGSAVRVEASDAFGRLVLETLGVTDAVAAPIADTAQQFGVVIAGKRTTSFSEEILESVRSFAQGSASARSQSELFERLANSNEELASMNMTLLDRTNVIRDIVYALSHDLRTPLTAAGMTMRQALDGRYGDLPEAYRGILDQSIRSNDELARLAETLLLVSRYESGESSQRRERVDARQTLRDVAAELAPLAQSKDVTIVVAGDAEEVAADPGEFRRAIVNLAANAIAWSQSGSTVTLTTGRNGDRLRIDVDDEGFGVPAGLRDRLFERMAGDSRRGAGSGLGLYIVRRIAQAHGGSVAYEPRSTGGSRFTLLLPLAQGQP